MIFRFAVPCVISLVVNALYNIVDQIFIGWGVGYLGNGATNVVFPITIIALALAVLVGDGAAAFFSLKLGEGDKASVKKGVGNAIVMVTIAGIFVMVAFLAFFTPILKLFGATDVLLPYAQGYGWIIAIGLPFTMISMAIIAAEIIAVIAFFIFQFAPMAVVSLFGEEENPLYNEFAVKCFRIFLLLCPLNGFQTVAAIYLQAIGKPIKSAVVTLSGQTVFLIPFALILPIFMGVEGVLWSEPFADGLAFILALAFILYEIGKLKHHVKLEYLPNRDSKKKTSAEPHITGSIPTVNGAKRKTTT